MRLSTLMLCALLPLSAVAQDSKAPQPRVLQAEGGRYVFGQISDFRADQFMLDTKTGRLWQIVVTRANENDTGGTKLLQVVPYVNPADDKWTMEPK